MSLIWPEAECQLCHQPLGKNFDDVLGFAFIGAIYQAVQQLPDNPALLEIVSRLPDAAVHASCLSRWEHRDTFIQFWNTQLRSNFGPDCDILTIDSNTRVTYTQA